MFMKNYDLDFTVGNAFMESEDIQRLPYRQHFYNPGTGLHFYHIDTVCGNMRGFLMDSHSFYIEYSRTEKPRDWSRFLCHEECSVSRTMGDVFYEWDWLCIESDDEDFFDEGDVFNE